MPLIKLTMVTICEGCLLHGSIVNITLSQRVVHKLQGTVFECLTDVRNLYVRWAFSANTSAARSKYWKKEKRNNVNTLLSSKLLLTNKNNYNNYYRVVFKWLSKVITWLRLLRLVIGLIALCTRDFSRASSELQVIARNSDWFMELFVPIVIGWSNCFGFGFSTVIWKPL